MFRIAGVSSMCIYIDNPLPKMVLPHEGDQCRLCHGGQYRIDQKTTGQSNVHHNNCEGKVPIKGHILTEDALGDLHDTFYESLSFGFFYRYILILTLF